MEKAFLNALPVMFTLMEKGYEAYFVGGSVRDHLMKRPVGDIDIATSARPEQVEEMFDKVIPVGIEHGTVIVHKQEDAYEITTFRIDGDYQDYRHPDEVKYVHTIEEDLSRRDFTMNAIAMNHEGELIDPYHGQDAISHKRIETVRDANERFHEDPLRMMRALRFASQLGFTIEHGTKQALSLNAPLLEKIAVERTQIEFEKLLKGQNLVNGLRQLEHSGLARFLPTFRDHQDLLPNLLSLNWKPLHGIYEAFAILKFIEPSISIPNLISDWKCSNEMKRETYTLVQSFSFFNKEQFNWLCYQLGEKRIESFVRVASILKMDVPSEEELLNLYSSLPITSKKELSVNGNDIKQWFPNKQPGPWMKDTIDKIEEAIVLGQIENNQETIETWVRLWNQQEEN